ncbi:S-protein homolog 24-like [Primulina eburnea]|uniref:S-protein homolog 24-like n=1 Tax=Primulina eburnea TaxID=1245227 RepID=UPI003C6C3C12
MKALILLFVLVFNLHVNASFALEYKRHCFTKRYYVYVANKLPSGSSLTLHCASKDDELGYHTLAVNENFHWTFCDSFLLNTLFFCHLWWGSKNIAFEAFYSELGKDCGRDAICYWQAESDGIYFRGSKTYDWEISKAM